MPAIVIAPYIQVIKALASHDISHVISLLGNSDRLIRPDTGNRAVIRLNFDDVGYSSGGLVAPSQEDIEKLIAFSQAWGGRNTLLAHCRAGTARSTAAGMIALASVPQLNQEANFRRLLSAKSYYRPNTRMLRLADKLLQSNLVEFAKEHIVRDGHDEVDIAMVELSTTPTSRVK